MMLGISGLVAVRIGLMAVGGAVATYLWEDIKNMKVEGIEAEATLNSWETLFHQMGIIKWDKGDRVKLIEKHERECYDLFEFEVSTSVSVAMIEKHLDSLKIKLKAPRLEVCGEGNKLYLKNLKTNVATKYFKIEDNKNKPTHLVPVLLNDDNELVCWDMKKDPNLFIAGTPGYGKSCLMNMIAAYLLSLKGVEQQHIDCKDGVELGMFEGLQQVTLTAKDEKAGKKMINGLLVTRRLRMEKIMAAGCKNYEQYIQEHDDLDRLVILIDEVADFNTAENQALNKSWKPLELGQTNVIQDLRQLTAKGRAAGVHVVMATQRSVMDNIDPSTKNNCTGIISFKMSNEHNSRLVIDETGLERLTEKGECIGILGGVKQHLRALYLDEDYLNEYVDGIRRGENDTATGQTNVGTTRKTGNSK